MSHFSSKDFGKTSSHIKVELPQRLIHQNVESTGADKIFSKEREHPVWIVDLPSHTLSLSVGELAAGKQTRLHRHTYETILYILEGNGQTQIEERNVDWQQGDAVYIPAWAWHRHRNETNAKCRYVACENAPLLQNLGGIAVREEADG